MTRCKLGDHISIKHGYAFDGEYFTDEDNGVVLVTPGNFAIGGGYQEGKGKYFIGEYPSEFVLQPDDLIVTMTDLSKRIDTLGYGALVPDDGRVYLHNQRIGLVQFIDDEVDKHYLSFLMKSYGYQRAIAGSSSGSTVHHSSPDKICAYEFDLPSIEVQRRIASILMAYDNLIENNRRQIALLEEAAQRLYKEWFIDLRFPNGKTSADATGWTQLSLTECANVIRGRSYTSAEIDGDEGVALVNLKNLRSFGGWNDGAEKTYSGAFKEEQHVGNGDIIMGVTDMTKERRLVGHVALVPDLEREAIISMDLVKLVPIQVENLYLYAHLRFSGIAENIALLANGTNVLHLKPQILSSVQIPIPSQNLQSDFARHMEPMVSKINLCSRRIASAQEARDRLLPKLMSGEIEV